MSRVRRTFPHGGGGCANIRCQELVDLIINLAGLLLGHAARHCTFGELLALLRHDRRILLAHGAAQQIGAAERIARQLLGDLHHLLLVDDDAEGLLQNSFERRIEIIRLLAAMLAVGAQAQQAITLHGASQFGDDHAFTKSMVRFEELVKKYYGKPVNFVLHKNSELGLEKDYFAYMNQGKAVDYAIVSPAHMSTFSKAAPFIDAPFLFSDLNHWNKVLDQDLLKPIADEVEQKAEVMLIGYAGGGVRNIFANKSATNLTELKNLKVRVQGAPIWSRAFAAVGMAPTVIAYNEVYNAIQNGVIQAGENEAAGVEAMKFYEVAPSILMTRHAITIRPLCFSVKTLKKLPADLQAAIIKAGKEAGAYGRQIESSEDQEKLDKYAKEGKLKQIPFTERVQMQKLVDPVMMAYAKEVGAEAIFAKINAIK